MGRLRAAPAPPSGAVRVALTLWLVGFLPALFFACSNSNERPAPIGVFQQPARDAAPSCLSSGEQGCPCSSPGQSAACGHVLYTSKDYVSCSMGHATCSADGLWGACVGDQVVTLNDVRSAGLKLQDQPAGVTASNPCDPALFQITTLLDAGAFDAAVSVVEAGLQITGVPQKLGSCTGLTITPSAPPTAAIQIATVAAPPIPNSLQFIAALTPTGCYHGTAQPIWTVDRPDVATMSSSGLLLLQFAFAGTMHVTAYLGTLSAVATVAVTVNALDTTQVADGGAIAQSFSSMCVPTDAGGGG